MGVPEKQDRTFRLEVTLSYLRVHFVPQIGAASAQAVCRTV